MTITNNKKKKILVVEDNPQYFNWAIGLFGKRMILANNYDSACSSYNGILTKRNHEIKVVITDLCCDDIMRDKFNPLRIGDNDSDSGKIYKDYCHTLLNYYKKTGKHMVYEMLRKEVNNTWKRSAQDKNQGNWEDEMNFSLEKGAHPIESKLADWIFGDRMGLPRGYLVAKKAEGLGIPVSIITTGGHHGCQWIPLLYSYLGGDDQSLLDKLIRINADSEKVVGRETNGKYETVGNVLITHCYEKTKEMWRAAMEIAK